MNQLPYLLYRAADVRELDRIAIEEYHTPGIKLMSRAGAVVFDELLTRWPKARQILVLCGGGNNGGDGFVVARLAQEKGLKPRLVMMADVERLSATAKLAWGAAQAAGVELTEFSPELLDMADVVVDALFGTGLAREVGGHYAEVIDQVNKSAIPVVAVDIPSGLHADSGRVLGHAIQADLTVTFIGLKLGLFSGVGPDHSGEIVFDDLDVDGKTYADIAPVAERMDWGRYLDILPPRRANSHKGDFGHVLVVGGNSGMGGAARLAAEAAGRVGAGLVSAAIRPGFAEAMAAARPEVMWHGIESIADLHPLLERATVVAIGPGLGQDAWAHHLLSAVLATALPLVVDADALNLLAQNPVKRDNWVLTPHPGEAARLLGCTTPHINDDRFDAARKIVQRFGGVCVLKGCSSLVADEGRHVALCSEGNPGMAVGGMGDVLTGVIAGLAAQKLSLGEAARAGVCLHAAAGDEAAAEGARGMQAGDLMVPLRYLVG